MGTIFDIQKSESEIISEAALSKIFPWSDTHFADENTLVIDKDRSRKISGDQFRSVKELFPQFNKLRIINDRIDTFGTIDCISDIESKPSIELYDAGVLNNVLLKAPNIYINEGTRIINSEFRSKCNFTVNNVGCRWIVIEHCTIKSQYCNIYQQGSIKLNDVKFACDNVTFVSNRTELQECVLNQVKHDSRKLSDLRCRANGLSITEKINKSELEIFDDDSFAGFNPETMFGCEFDVEKITLQCYPLRLSFFKNIEWAPSLSPNIKIYECAGGWKAYLTDYIHGITE